MKYTIIAAICALVLPYMSAAAEKAPENISWDEIVSGDSNIKQATRQIIQDQEQWQKWWDKHNSVMKEIDGKLGPIPAPKVDFGKKTVLVATLGERPSSSYGIHFTGIRREVEVVIATFKTTSPDPDSFDAAVMTAPISVIAIPKHEGRVEFVDETAK